MFSLFCLFFKYFLSFCIVYFQDSSILFLCFVHCLFCIQSFYFARVCSEIDSWVWLIPSASSVSQSDSQGRLMDFKAARDLRGLTLQKSCTRKMTRAGKGLKKDSRATLKVRWREQKRRKTKGGHGVGREAWEAKYGWETWDVAGIKAEREERGSGYVQVISSHGPEETVAPDQWKLISSTICHGRVRETRASSYASWPHHSDRPTEEIPFPSTSRLALTRAHCTHPLINIKVWLVRSSWLTSSGMEIQD